VKINSELTHPARLLTLVVAHSDGSELDLEDMQDLSNEDGVFNFNQLIRDYDIHQYNPILVKLLGK
jgi:hypothetical protein